MGMTRTGRFAAITNYRDPSTGFDAPRSRGELPLDFLTADWRRHPGSELLDRQGHDDPAVLLAPVDDRGVDGEGAIDVEAEIEEFG